MAETPRKRSVRSDASVVAGALFVFGAAALGCASPAPAPAPAPEPLPETREGIEAAIQEDRARLEALVVQPRPTAEEGEPIAADPQVMEIGSHLTALQLALEELDEESREAR